MSLQFCLNYGDTENVLINHLLVIPMLYPCHYTNLCPHKPHKHAHTHTHTHTHSHTHSHTGAPLWFLSLLDSIWEGGWWGVLGWLFFSPSVQIVFCIPFGRSHYFPSVKIAFLRIILTPPAPP